MGNESRERQKTLKIDSKGNARNQKNIVTKINSAFDGPINTLDTAKERINELEGMSIQTSKTNMQREKRLKNTEQNILELWGNYKRYDMHSGNTTKKNPKKHLKRLLRISQN